MSREVKQTKTKNGTTSSSVWKWKQVVTEYWETDPTHAEYYLTTNKSFVKVEGFLGRGDSASYFGGSAKTTFVCGGKTKENTKTYTYPTNVAANSWYSMYSYTFEMQHDPDGTKTIDVSTKMTTSAFNPDSASAKDTITLTAIPRKAMLLSATNFTDEENPVITYDNPVGEEVELLQAAITDAEGGVQYARYRDIPKTESSYTFELTDDERTVLRNAVGESEWIYVAFYVKTIIGETSYFSELVRKLTIVGGEPVITATIADINPVTLALTGNHPEVFIKGYSNAEYTLDIAAQKGAKLIGYTVDCGDYSIAGSIDNLESTTIKNTIPSIESGIFLVTATDNRGAVGYYSAPQELIDYKDPVCYVQFVSMSGTGTLEFYISGGHFVGKFGENGVENSFRLQWRFKEVGGTYSEWFEVDTNTFDKTFGSGGWLKRIEHTLTDPNGYKKVYVLQARVTDLLNPDGILSKEIQTFAEPIFDWGFRDFNFNVRVLMRDDLHVLGNLMCQGAIGGHLMPSVLGSTAYDGETGEPIVYPVDLDDYVYPGFYGVDSNFDVSTTIHAPELTSFTLLIEGTEIDLVDMDSDETMDDPVYKSLKQTFTSINTENPKTWIRTGVWGDSGLEWGPWKRLYFDSDLYPVGAVETTSTMNGTQVGTAADGTKQYTLPNRPGVWELFDKEFAPFNGEVSDALTLNTTNATSCKLFCMRSGHSMRIKYEFVNKVAITDGTFTMTNTNFVALGLIDGDLYYTYDCLHGGTDGGNSIGIFKLYANGRLDSIDFNPKEDGDSNIPAGSTIFVDVTVPVLGTNMINSFCNKFYWKRVS